MRRKKINNRLVIGVTGILGSGKSTVSHILKSLGSKVIEADKVARKYLAPGASTYKRIVDYFGRGILKANKEIDRRKLAGVVFKDHRLLKKLNSIAHPKIGAEIKRRIGKLKSGVIVLDAPLLIEAGLRSLVDNLIVVIIEQDELIRRLAKKRALKKKEIMERVKSKISLRKKVRMADFIIDNNGTISQTRKQVNIVMDKLRRKLWRS